MARSLTRHAFSWAASTGEKQAEILLSKMPNIEWTVRDSRDYVNLNMKKLVISKACHMGSQKNLDADGGRLPRKPFRFGQTSAALGAGAAE
jgi:hypothetical protein